MVRSFPIQPGRQQGKRKFDQFVPPALTRLPRRTYPRGEFVVCDPTNDRSCRPECAQTPGCQNFMSSHTCSILRFCPDTADAKVFLMKDFEHSESCNFEGAVELAVERRDLQGATGESGIPCIDYVFEEDHELTEYFFSSPDGCATGQRLGVKIQDFEMTAAQCEAIGFTTQRLRNCDCLLQKNPSTLGEPCRTAFSDSCQSVVQEGECCESGTCISKLEDYSHPMGMEAETKRREECDDAVPGLCYNEDGKGTDTNRMGSTNCCTHTCSSCGIETSPFVKWHPCNSFDSKSQTANCGFLSRYDDKAFVCDFSKCQDGDPWAAQGQALQHWAVSGAEKLPMLSSVVVGFSLLCATMFV